METLEKIVEQSKPLNFNYKDVLNTLNAIIAYDISISDAIIMTYESRYRSSSIVLLGAEFYKDKGINKI